MNTTRLLLRDELIAQLLEDQRAHPSDNWPVELRDRWLVGRPEGLERCPIDQVIILRGEPAICCARPKESP